MNVRPSFHLLGLDLDCIPLPACIPLPGGVLNALLASSSSTLRTLRLTNNGETSSSVLLPLALLSFLETLEIGTLRPLPGLDPILSTIPSFTNFATILENLVDITELDGFFAPFDPPLPSLVVGAYRETVEDGVVLTRALAERVGKKAWEGWEHVYLYETDESNMSDEILVKLCAEKEIMVEYGFLQG